jgi:hypothetical protein
MKHPPPLRAYELINTDPALWEAAQAAFGKSAGHALDLLLHLQREMPHAGWRLTAPDEPVGQRSMEVPAARITNDREDDVYVAPAPAVGDWAWGVYYAARASYIRTLHIIHLQGDSAANARHVAEVAQRLAKELAAAAAGVASIFVDKTLPVSRDRTPR